MQLISIPEPVMARQAAREAAADEALAGMIASIGDAAFGSEALAQLNRWMPMCWWSVYCLFEDVPPRLHASGSFGVSDGTLDSWRAYRASLYRRDESFASARELLSDADLVLLHWHAREFPTRHREAIYRRHGLRERFSLVAPHVDAGLLCVNFYRHDVQRPFSDDEIDAIRRLGRPLLAAVQRHLALAGRAQVDDEPLRMLTRREREVCERILKGWTHDGIAADLRVSPATVKTYRDRAFERLGVHHRNELFALVAGRLVLEPRKAG